MKNSILAIILFILFQSCDNFEPDHSMISPLSATKIDQLQINSREVTTTVTYSIGTPCWHFYKTEKSNVNDVFTSKVYGKYEGEICVQVVSSLKHTEQINFTTSGTKTLRFWQNDSTYLDTVIVIQ